MNVLLDRIEKASSQKVVWLAGKAATEAMSVSDDKNLHSKECKSIIKYAVAFDDRVIKRNREAIAPRPLIEAIQAISKHARLFGEWANYVYWTHNLSLDGRRLSEAIRSVQNSGETTKSAWERNETACRTAAYRALVHSCNAIMPSRNTNADESSEQETISQIGNLILDKLEAITESQLRKSKSVGLFFSEPLIKPSLVKMAGSVNYSDIDSTSRDTFAHQTSNTNSDRVAKLKVILNDLHEARKKISGNQPFVEVKNVYSNDSHPIPLVDGGILFDLTGMTVEPCDGASSGSHRWGEGISRANRLVADLDRAKSRKLLQTSIDRIRDEIKTLEWA